MGSGRWVGLYAGGPPPPGIVGGILGEVHAKAPGLYQVPMLRNLNFCFCTVCSRGGGPPPPGIVGGIQGEVLAKTPGLYQVPKLRNLRQKNFGHFLGTDRPTDRPTW